VPHVDLVADGSFADLDPFGHVAGQRFDFLLESFELTDAWIVARQDALRPRQLGQRGRDLGQAPVDALRQRLQHQVVAVAIDDQGRQAIGFAVHETVGGGVELQRLTEPQGRRQPIAHEAGGRRFRPERYQAQRDLGSIAEERVADDAAAAAGDAHEIAGRRVGLGDVAAIDPRMPGARPVFTLARNGGGRHGL
jgi:hypothetical protein